MAEPVVRFTDVDIVFGQNPSLALTLIQQGYSRADIQSACGQTVGVAQCSLEVYEGEVLVLMGLSGSGKSTLLRAVNGLNDVHSGSVTVRRSVADEWRKPHSCSARELRELRLNWVSMVFQQFGLLPWRSVAENVRFGLELAGQDGRSIASTVDAQLEMVGLVEWADKPVHALSGGMQQRVGLARAFATNAPILLMDEPYSALDPLIRARLQDELMALQSTLKRTILFVSHDLDEAMKIGHRIAIMEGGRLVQCGTPVEIFTQPANGYVADFVAHMNPMLVLNAAHAMQAADSRPAEHAQAAIVSPDTRLTDVMSVQLSSGLPVYVQDNGEVLGRVSYEDIHRALLARQETTSKNDL